MTPQNRLNFSGGPGVLPESVLLQAQQAVVRVPEIGLSVLGISHQSDWFAAVVAETERNIRTLLNLPDSHAVLFLQGGASLQYTMIPMLLLRGSRKSADYVVTGYWSGKAVSEARLEGDVRVLWNGEATGFKRLPAAESLRYNPDAAYVHYVSNETAEGTQFKTMLGLDGVPRVCDMSSDFLSRPIDASRFDLIYAHAQKNLGAAGVTIVIVRKSLLENAPSDLPAMLDYRKHLAANSIYNTPPVFALYTVLLVTRWLLRDIGGLPAMAAINRRKAASLYALLDGPYRFYTGWARKADRSLMNVTFRLPSPELEVEFVRQAEAAGFSGLAGHRALGGIRASLYNAMTQEAVEQLCEFMADFRCQQHATLRAKPASPPQPAPDVVAPAEVSGVDGPEPCGCRRCLAERDEQVDFGGGVLVPVAMTRMILCPQCGNKRCPHANDHRLACTNSNLPGQPGSAYPLPAGE